MANETMIPQTDEEHARTARRSLGTPGAYTRSTTRLSKKKLSGTNKDTNAMKRYLQCPGMCPMHVLRKFITRKYSVDEVSYEIEILYKRVPLPDYYTLIDVAYIYSWKRNEPMRFCYTINDRLTSAILPPPDPVDNVTITHPLKTEPPSPSTEESSTVNVKSSHKLNTDSPTPANESLTVKLTQLKSEAPNLLKKPHTSSKQKATSETVAASQPCKRIKTEQQPQSSHVLNIEPIEKKTSCMPRTDDASDDKEEVEDDVKELVRNCIKNMVAADEFSVAQDDQMLCDVGDLKTSDGRKTGKVDTGAEKVDTGTDSKPDAKFTCKLQVLADTAATLEAQPVKSVPVKSRNDFEKCSVKNAETVTANLNQTDSPTSGTEIPTSDANEIKIVVTKLKQPDAQLNTSAACDSKNIPVPITIIPSQVIEKESVFGEKSKTGLAPLELLLAVVAEKKPDQTETCTSQTIPSKSASTSQSTDASSNQTSCVLPSTAKTFSKLAITIPTNVAEGSSTSISPVQHLKVLKSSKRSPSSSPRGRPKGSVKANKTLPVVKPLDEEKQNFLNFFNLTPWSSIPPPGLKRSKRKAKSISAPNLLMSPTISNVEKTPKKSKSFSTSTTAKSPKSLSKSLPSTPTSRVNKVSSTVAVVPVVKQNAALQSLFDSCKINIPSSLSITLKDCSATSERSNLIEPVINHIEILKLPDAAEVDMALEKTSTLVSGADVEQVGKNKLSLENLDVTISKVASRIGMHANLPAKLAQNVSKTPVTLSQSATAATNAATFQRMFEEAVKRSDFTTKTSFGKRLPAADSTTSPVEAKRAKLDVSVLAPNVSKEQINPPNGKVAIPRLVTLPKKSPKPPSVAATSVKTSKQLPAPANNQPSSKAVPTSLPSSVQFPNLVTTSTSNVRPVYTPPASITITTSPMSSTITSLVNSTNHRLVAPCVSPKPAAIPETATNLTITSSSGHVPKTSQSTSSSARASSSTVSSSPNRNIAPKPLPNIAPKPALSLVPAPRKSPSIAPKPSQSPKLGKHTNLPPQIATKPVSNKSAKASTSKPGAARSTAASPIASAATLCPNQLLEKYNIQNLAQLSASLNMMAAAAVATNPSLLKHLQQQQQQQQQQLSAQLQAAAVLQQQQQLQIAATSLTAPAASAHSTSNWMAANDGPLLQYEKYLQTLAAAAAAAAASSSGATTSKGRD